MKTNNLVLLSSLAGVLILGLLEADMTQAAATEKETKTGTESASSLLPSAKPGECYAKILLPAKYKTEQIKLLKKAEGAKIELIPGKYQSSDEKVLTEEASAKLIPVQTKYKTETVKYKINEGRRYWATSMKPGARVAGDALLNAVKASGLKLESATTGTCYHEHYTAPQYKVVKEKILIKEASEKIEIIPAKYETIEKKILVKDASFKLISVPETYETVSEKVLVAPATSVWKKGSRPVEAVDNSTGEIMCLVKIPAKYKTVTNRVLATPAMTKKVEIPAVYKTIKVTKLVEAAKEVRTPIPEKHDTITKKVLEADGKYFWHEMNDDSMSPESETGNQICLREILPEEGSYTKKVVANKPAVKKVELPAKYTAVKIQKIAVKPSQKSITIPAVYQTVAKRVKVSDEHMEWVPILCETNFNKPLITELQRKLKEAGFNPGTIDGVYGGGTKTAINAFQRKKGLPTGQLTIATLQALGVKH
jgi:hypothetical protein